MVARCSSPDVRRCISPLVAPEVLESRRGEFGIADGVLNAPMAEPILDRPRIMPCVRQREAASVPEHV
jgi:hypothetical protein